MVEARDNIRREESEFNPGEVAVVAVTSYPAWCKGEARNAADTDKIRGDLCVATLSAGVDRGFHMIVADGGSSEEFTEALKGLPVTYLA